MSIFINFRAEIPSIFGKLSAGARRIKLPEIIPRDELEADNAAHSA